MALPPRKQAGLCQPAVNSEDTPGQVQCLEEGRQQMPMPLTSLPPRVSRDDVVALRTGARHLRRRVAWRSIRLDSAGSAQKRRTSPTFSRPTMLRGMRSTRRVCASAAADQPPSSLRRIGTQAALNRPALSAAPNISPATAPTMGPPMGPAIAGGGAAASVRSGSGADEACRWRGALSRDSFTLYSGPTPTVHCMCH
jgi:hypothetical protein